MGTFQPIPRPGQFCIRGRFLPNPIDFRFQSRRHFCQGTTGGRRGFDHKLAGNFRRIVADADALGYLLFIDQGAVQAGTLPIGQDCPQHFQRRLLRIPLGPGRPSHINAGQRYFIPHFQFYPPGQRRIKPPNPRGRRPRRQIPEIAVH